MTSSGRKRGGGGDVPCGELAGGLLQRAVHICSRPLSLASITAIVLFEIALNLSIVSYVPYTEIDWEAYMQQVGAFHAGELDYIKIKGGTGPLVYPAGFLYVFSVLKALSGGGTNILAAQMLFTFIYALNSLVILLTYRRAQLPARAVLPLLLSKRVHSIFVLRLFNDCVASLIAHSAVLALSHSKMKTAATLLSLGVSVKMNVSGRFRILPANRPFAAHILPKPVQ